ncbi:hypothetical protein M885DRAFT_505963 [Pelagophyceae sp. CCMP2097]|nr:hypothetical protein M885DRAFT_505963 [Pelagophyceae sp. CCMP2097]
MSVRVSSTTPTVIIKKGLSYRGGIRAFGWGTIFGSAAGFAGGFLLAQAIYSDEEERKHVKRTMKITACAMGGAFFIGTLGTFLVRK